MIDEFDMCLAIQRQEISYYDFQKWTAAEREIVSEDNREAIYDEGYNAGSDDGYSQEYEDGLSEAP